MRLAFPRLATRRNPLDANLLARDRHGDLLVLLHDVLGDADLSALALPLLHLELFLGDGHAHLLPRAGSGRARLLAVRGLVGLTETALELDLGEPKPHLIAADRLDVVEPAGVVLREEDALLDDDRVPPHRHHLAKLFAVRRVNDHAFLNAVHVTSGFVEA